MENNLINNEDYLNLLNTIGNLVSDGRAKVLNAIDKIVIRTYWNIGKYIVEYEQKGGVKSEYGAQLLIKIAKDLRLQKGIGFSRSNLQYMRLFYLQYPKDQEQYPLTWSHYVELLSISDANARGFYEQQAIKDNWSIRELKRFMDTAVFERIAVSKDKEGILRLAKEGLDVTHGEDLIKKPFILEFLGLQSSKFVSEKTLENKITENLKDFLLELGKGFAFVSRQERLHIGKKYFYVDLLFYHMHLKSYVLIDLKINQAEHNDVGQMNMYLNYFKKERVNKGDNPPIGIILALNSEQDVDVEYALGGIGNLFVSEYKLYLPDKKELENKVKSILEEDANRENYI